MKTHLILLLLFISTAPLLSAESESEKLRTQNMELRAIVEKLTQRIQQLEEQMQQVQAMLNVEEPDIQQADSSNRVAIHSKGSWSVNYYPDRRQVGLHRYEIAEIKGFLKLIKVKVFHENFDRTAWSTEGQKYTLKTPSGKIINGTVKRPIVILYKTKGWHWISFTSKVPFYTGKYELEIIPQDAKTIKDRAPFTLEFTPGKE